MNGKGRAVDHILVERLWRTVNRSIFFVILSAGTDQGRERPPPLTPEWLSVVTFVGIALL